MKRSHSYNKKILADGKRETKYHYSCRICSAEIRYAQGLDKVPQLAYEKLEEIIIAVLQRQMEICVDIDALIAEVTNSIVITNQRHSLKSEIIKCQRDSKNADDMLASAYNHHLAGLLDKKEFALAREKFERDKRVAEAKSERIKFELERYDLEKQRKNAFLENFRCFKNFAVLNKDIVSALIHRVDVSPLTNEITISLNFMDELEKLNNLIEESGVLTDAC
jgi:hypothetical protein